MSVEEFRDDLKQIIKSHDITPDELRDVSGDLERLAQRWDDAEDVL